MVQPDEEETERRSSVFRLTLLRDIIVRPARAYEEILAKPSWLPAFVFVLACGLFDLWVSAPAILHVMGLAIKHHAGSQYAAGTAATRNSFFADSALYQIVQPLVTWSLTASVASTAARFKRVRIPYPAFFSLAAVCTIPSGLGAVCDGIAVAIHPPAFYANLKALALALPDNLALFASPANDREVVFFSSFGVFDLWSSLLLAYGLVAFAKLRITTGLCIAFSLDIIVALLFGG